MGEGTKLEKIYLYTTNCPNCRTLELMLNKNGLEYVKEENTETIIAKGFSTAPVLQVGDKYYTFKDAIRWIKENRV